MSASNDAMETLTNQWYNALVTGLSLDPGQFQLYQGAGASPKTSMEMWNIFNAVPPESVNSYYNPAEANSFAGDYNSILSSLVTGTDNDFQNCMGDFYGQWKDYITKNPPSGLTATNGAKTFGDAFTNWSVINAPSQSSCVSALTKNFINPVQYANNAFQAANNIFAWNKTLTHLQNALAGGRTGTAELNSKTASSDTTHTWAEGSVRVFFDLFSFGGGGNFDSETTQAISSGLYIKAEFDKYATLAAGPYDQVNNNDPAYAAAGAQPWYMGAVMTYAYTTQDNTVWNNQKPVTWEKAFGDNGFMQRMVTALVVVDGIKITMQSEASFSSSDQTKINKAASTGLWPFFSADGQGGTTNNIKFDDKGRMTCTTTVPKGNPQILGVLQTESSKVFS